MKLTLDSTRAVNLIRSYGPGELRVGERIVRTNCIVTAEALITDWRPATPAELRLADLEPIFSLTPEVVLLGTGATLEFPAAEIRAAFTGRGIGLETMNLGGACRTFNVLVQEGRRVAAALFVV